MRATLSLMGLYNYDSTIFRGFYFPEKWTAEDKETFINKLLFDTAELELIYPDPTVMNQAMQVWSRANLPNWNKLYLTTILDYNPIWNKDGTITESEKINRNNQYQDQRDGTGSENESTSENSNSTQTNNLDQSNSSKTVTATNTASDTTGKNEQTTGSNTTQKDYVFGFNESDKAQSEQHETDASETINGTSSQNVIGTGSETTDFSADQKNTGTVTNSETTNGSRSGSSKNSETLGHTGSDDESREYIRRETGNIGVTTTQQMIQEEREVDKFNLMDYIIDSFKNRFCILVY